MLMPDLRLMYDGGMMMNTIVYDRCTGPNPACRKAHRAGRSVHIMPARMADGCSLILPTYHFATEAEGRAIIEDATANAPVVRTDDDLYAYRAAGVAHKLPVGWIDPTRR